MTKKQWFILCLAVSALDQITKRLFAHANQVLIPGVVALRGTQNTGAAFSFLAHRPFVVALLSFALFALLIYVAFRFLPDKPLSLALAFASGGALGNLIDRAARGYVVDFIETLFIDFPIFNVADIAITLGMIAAAGLILFRREQSHA